MVLLLLTFYKIDFFFRIIYFLLYTILKPIIFCTMMSHMITNDLNFLFNDGIA